MLSPSTRLPEFARCVASPLMLVVVGACGDDPIDPGDTPQFAVILAAGDVADCATPHDEETANLLDPLPGWVLTLGDNAYESGTAQEFMDCYDPSWGRHLDRTRPTAGNHDYQTPDAAGYFDYFGSRAGNRGEGVTRYYGGRGWVLIGLNSNIDISNGSAQLTFLEDFLTEVDEPCTVAFWHHPRFSSGQHGNDTTLSDVWRLLYDHGVDVVLNGHDHDYERFAPQDPDGVLDTIAGVQEFVVGTGGRALRPFGALAANSEFRDSDNYGVLLMRLYADRYEWEFRTVDGPVVADSGGMMCR